ncbi:MAG: DNA alkylation repair protein [Phycisphaerales bacterium]|nr:DNA alkylation repair protein [Phycisphaerales bacterium]
MPTKRPEPPVRADAKTILASLERRGNPKVREQMCRQFGITGPSASTSFGIKVGELRAVAKELRRRGKSEEDAARNHRLAIELWDTGQYEARLLAAFVDEPALVTVAQMNRWAKDFDNWAVCDTACFCLFDRAPSGMTFGRVLAWSKAKDEFVKRGAFALLASLALHDRASPDSAFLRCLPLIERGARDERNLVKKGVSWALRGMGRRPTLRARAIELATRLADSDDPAARWVGKDALRDLRRR